MERERDEATTSTAIPDGDFTKLVVFEPRQGGGGGTGTGTGGKLRKSSNSRKPPLTPYYRPPQTLVSTQANGDDGGGRGMSTKSSWFSTATRLISGGAGKLLPYFFSPGKTSVGVSDRNDDVENQEADQDDSDEETQYVTESLISQPVDGTHVPEEAKVSSSGPSMVKFGAGDESSLSQIEQMMKTQTFSKDDLNRLTEVLSSRIADQAGVGEREFRNTNAITGSDPSSGLLREENLITSGVEEKAIHVSRFSSGVVPFFQTRNQDPICASPIDIAKAYMGGRTSDSALTSRTLVSWDEKTPIKDYPLKPSNPPASPICWPGSMLHDQRPYLTPQTQKDRRVDLYNLPRTPYSRAISSRSTSKLQGGVDRSIDIFSNLSKRSQPPLYGDSQVGGSVGPIRRGRRNFGGASSSQGGSSSSRVNTGPYWNENIDASKGPSLFEKNLEPGPSSSRNLLFASSNVKAPRSSVALCGVHAQSSETARKILEQLDRTVATPQKKAAEIKLGTSWNKPPPSSSLEPKVQLNHSTEVKTDSVNMNGSNTKKLDSSDALRSKTKSADFPVHAVEEPARPVDNPLSGNKQNSNNIFVGYMDVSRPMQNSIAEAPKMERKPPSNCTSGHKPALSSIAVAKPDSKRHFTSLVNGSGFTFPISASSGNLAEPPTPSMPSSSPSGQSQVPNKAVDPVFTFGSKTAGNNSLVFSFPSTSSSIPADTTTPSFSFGVEKKRDRISFVAVGKGAFCY